MGARLRTDNGEFRHRAIAHTHTFRFPQSSSLSPPARARLQATRVSISVWKKTSPLTEDIPLGHVYFDFNKIRSCRRERELRRDLKKSGQFEWVNLYGAPIGVKQKRKGALDMNTYPAHASHFRGRVLVNMRTVVSPPPEFNNVPERKKLDPAIVNAHPTSPMAKYTLRAFVGQGCEIPMFSRLVNAVGESGSVAKMKVRICIGSASIEYPYAINKKGVVKWNTQNEVKNIDLPENIEQVI